MKNESELSLNSIDNSAEILLFFLEIGQMTVKFRQNCFPEFENDHDSATRERKLEKDQTETK